MPTNMPEIKQLLADWYLLALDNLLFVGALIVVVWALLALLYNFKILSLKKQHKTAQKLHLAVQDKLTAVEQQIRQQEEKLAADAQQMLKDKQFIAEIEDKLSQRNQIVVANIRAVASKFDLSEQLVDSGKAMQDEFIWQQQDNIVQQLSDRVSVAQQENAQAGEKDSLITNLQNSLDMQIKQFAQLEQTIELQKHIQQEQQKEVQQQLTNTLEKHQLDFTQLIQAVQNRPVDFAVEQNIKQDTVPIVQQQERKPENIAEQQIVEFNAVEQVTAGKVDSQLEVPEILDSVAKLEDILEQKVKDEPSISDSIEAVDAVKKSEIQTVAVKIAEVKTEVEPVSEPDSLVQDLLNIAEPAFSTVTENETQQAQTKTSDKVKSNLNVAGKFKSLLGKVKKSKTKTEPEQKIKTFTVEAPKAPEPEQQIETFTAEDLKAPEPEQKIETFTAEDLKVPESEQQIESFKSGDFKQPEVEDVHVEPNYGTSNFKVPGALKKLFGKVKK